MPEKDSTTRSARSMRRKKLREDAAGYRRSTYALSLHPSTSWRRSGSASHCRPARQRSTPYSNGSIATFSCATNSLARERQIAPTKSHESYCRQSAQTGRQFKSHSTIACFCATRRPRLARMPLSNWEMPVERGNRHTNCRGNLGGRHLGCQTAFKGTPIGVEEGPPFRII